MQALLVNLVVLFDSIAQEVHDYEMTMKDGSFQGAMYRIGPFYIVIASKQV